MATPPSSPLPVAPTENQPIDGSAAPFEWTSAPGAHAYRLQIATDADFTDVLYTINAGSTTLLTLYQMLPENGTAFHWRVQARMADGWQAWSPGAAFRATTAGRARPAEKARADAASATTSAAPGATAPVEDGAAPYKTAVTSRVTTFAVFAIMLLSFLITTVLIIRAAP